MLKLIGSAIVVAAGGAAGMLMAAEYSRRPAELRSLIAAVQMLETEIIYAATPLKDALLRVASLSDKNVATLFREAALELGDGSGSTATEAWELSIGRFYRRSSLSTGHIEILRNLGRALGKSGQSDQEKHLKLTCEQLKREMSRAEEAAARNTRMWNYLGFCGALAIVVILY